MWHSAQPTVVFKSASGTSLLETFSPSPSTCMAAAGVTAAWRLFGQLWNRPG